ncbi:MAG: hypothetical protein QGF47_09150, partial [Arenicellales bacterium]|nr:hypothetical protein [Arenicellales bacterium]
MSQTCQPIRAYSPHPLDPLRHAGYKLIPGPNIKPMHQPDSPFMRRAGFVNHDLWVTAYDPDQLHAPGRYVSQNEGGP